MYGVVCGQPLARAILEGTYEATLATGAVLSLQRGERVQVCVCMYVCVYVCMCVFVHV